MTYIDERVPRFELLSFFSESTRERRRDTDGPVDIEDEDEDEDGSIVMPLASLLCSATIQGDRPAAAPGPSGTLVEKYRSLVLPRDVAVATTMCRWIAYTGNPIPMSRLIYEPEHSLIDQSLSARLNEHTTNGDGFGVGWYDHVATPGIYRHMTPAWNDPNLLDLCTHVRSPLFMAHIRAATATPVQQTNCHPFRYRNWLFVHNGVVRGFELLRREMAIAVHPSLYTSILGSTDSELMFFLALTFGLAENPYEGVARMVGFIEDLAVRNGVIHPLQMTLGIADGKTLFAVRYSSERASKSLFYSASVATIRELIPVDQRHNVDAFGECAVSVVSEPLHGLEGGWIEVPESTFLSIGPDGTPALQEFQPTHGAS